MAFSKYNYFPKNSVAPVSHEMLRYSSNETRPIAANLSASATNSWKMDLAVVPITPKYIL